jgi:amidase
VIEAAIAEMKRRGAEIVDPADIPTAGKFDDSESLVLSYEFKNDLNLYLGALGPKAPVHSLADVIAFNESHREQEMPYFGQDIMIKAQARGPLTSKEYLDALEKDHRLSRTEGIDAVMGKYPPGCPGGAHRRPGLVYGLDQRRSRSGRQFHARGRRRLSEYQRARGLCFGLPVGISFFGAANSEALLIKLAYAFEQATRHRRAPKFLPRA